MPYCPNCLEEYDDGMTACVMCGSDLLDGSAPGNCDEDLGDMEPVFVGPLAKALPVKSALEDEGFSVYLAGDEEVHISSEALAGPQTMVKIMVPSENAVAASKVVEEAAGVFDAPLEGDQEPDPDPLARVLGLFGADDATGKCPEAPDSIGFQDKPAMKAGPDYGEKKQVATGKPAERAKAVKPKKTASAAKPKKTPKSTKTTSRPDKAGASSGRGKSKTRRP